MFKFAIKNGRLVPTAAGRIETLTCVVDMPALRGEIDPQKAVEAYAACLNEPNGEKELVETAGRRMRFWMHARNSGNNRETTIQEWKEQIG